MPVFPMAGFSRPSPSHPDTLVLAVVVFAYPRDAQPLLSSPHALPITLSAVAMLLLYLASKKGERKEERKYNDIIIQQWKRNNNEHSYYSAI